MVVEQAEPSHKFFLARLPGSPFEVTLRDPIVCVRNYAFGAFHNGDRSPLVPRTARTGRRRTPMRLPNGSAKQCSVLPSHAKPEKTVPPVK
jgi:hypothetical protein